MPRGPALRPTVSLTGHEAPEGGAARHRELAAVFLRISLLGFGGPNAHLALMLDEAVERRKWVSREHFLQLIGITNLLPGPNSSQVAIHLGYTQRGWTGALTAGLCFLGPTFLMVTTLAWLYFRFGTLPQADPLFWALKPVIVALILWAGWRLGRPFVTRPLLFGLALLGAFVTYFAGRWAVAAMMGGAVLTWWGARRRWGGVDAAGARSGHDPLEGEPRTGRGPRRQRPSGDSVAGDAPASPADVEPLAPSDRAGPPSRPHGDEPPHPADPSGSDGHDRRGGWLLLPVAGLSLATAGIVARVFLLHLGIGCVLFGGGYVLVALLQPYAVDVYGWLSPGQFLDGVALSQAVPGPISTLSAFVGYAAAGLPGAVAGTAGVYLPAFAVVLLAAPHVDRLRRLRSVQAALEGVSAVVAGTILGVGLFLLPPALPDMGAAILFVFAIVAFVRFRVASHWMVLLGLGIGVARFLLS